MTSTPARLSDAEGIQLPGWTKVLGWCGIAGLIWPREWD
jgi:hypothetical protein